MNIVWNHLSPLAHQLRSHSDPLDSIFKLVSIKNVVILHYTPLSFLVECKVAHNIFKDIQVQNFKTKQMWWKAIALKCCI